MTYQGPTGYAYGDDEHGGPDAPDDGDDYQVNYLDDDADEVGWEPPGQDEVLECCPNCLLLGTALTHVQDAHGREVVTCQRCQQRVRPALVPAPDRGSGQQWGDDYFQAAYSTPEPPRRPRPQGLTEANNPWALRRSPQPGPKPKSNVMLPRESATRPTS